MKSLQEYITEAAIDENGLKKAVKKNGITVPSGSEVRGIYLRKAYNHGFRGSTELRKLRDKLSDNNWTELDDQAKESFTPDGTWMCNSDMYISPDKTVICATSSAYGGTSYDNSYECKFALVKDFEDEINKELALEQMKSVLQQLGHRFPSTMDMVDVLTFHSGSAATRLPKNMDQLFKKIEDGHWEDKDVDIVCKKGRFWPELTVTLKKLRKPFKLV